MVKEYEYKTPYNSRKLTIQDGRDSGYSLEMEGHILSDRPYKLPKGYAKWSDIAGTMAMAIVGSNKGDDASLLHQQKVLLWLALNAPCYCVSHNLMNELQETTLPSGPGSMLLQDIDLDVYTALFCFPQGAIKTPEGGYIDHVIFHISDMLAPQRSMGTYRGKNLRPGVHEHQDRINIQWSAIDSRNVVWVGGCGLDDHGSLIIRRKPGVGTERMNDTDYAFTDNVRSLILQCWFLACFPNDSVEEFDIAAASTSQRPKSRNAKRQKYWTPRILKTENTSHSHRRGYKIGDRKPPRAHWRNQAYGPGWSKRRLVRVATENE